MQIQIKVVDVHIYKTMRYDERVVVTTNLCTIRNEVECKLVATEGIINM